jgi:glycosyltransferase involved in cell wall biosynthesis
LIVAIKDVEAYIDDFVRSVLAQNQGLRDVEVILVDDGSIDSTLDRVHRWEDSHPHVVKVLRSPGAGPAEARNEGLRSARGLWVSFPDGDDLLASDYLRQVRTAIAENGGDLGCVMTKLVNYFEVDGTRADSHPLTFKFSRSTTVELIGTTPRAIQLSAATVFLPRDILVSEGLEFDPTFEDGHLVNRVLSRMLDRTVAYVPAEYSYRRRASGGSLTNLAPQSTSWYLECVEFGHLGLLDDCRRRLGDVPEFVKWTVLYDLIPKLRHLVHHPEVGEVLGDDGAERFHELLTAVIREVGSRTIREYDLPGLTEEYRVGLLRLAGDVPSSPSRRVYVEEWNPRRCEARLSWLAAELDEPPVVFSLGARPAATRPGG